MPGGLCLVWICHTVAWHMHADGDLLCHMGFLRSGLRATAYNPYNCEPQAHHRFKLRGPPAALQQYSRRTIAPPAGMHSMGSKPCGCPFGARIARPVRAIVLARASCDEAWNRDEMPLLRERIQALKVVERERYTTAMHPGIQAHAPRCVRHG